MNTDFKKWLGEQINPNPADDVDQYITGLKNRLMLLRPEEIPERRENLMELKQLLDRLLS